MDDRRFREFVRIIDHESEKKMQARDEARRLRRVLAWIIEDLAFHKENYPCLLRATILRRLAEDGLDGPDVWVRESQPEEG